MCKYLFVICLLVAIGLGTGSLAVGAPIMPPGTPKSTAPMIDSILPGSGSPGNTVMIKALNTPADKTKVEVWFTIADKTTAQGTVGNVTVAQSVITYMVQVPGGDNVTAPYSGPLYIKIKEDGRVTPSKTFRILPITPKITSHSPQYGAPGKTTTFKGANFKATDVISVSNAPGVKLEFHSVTEIAVTLPANYPTTDKLIRVTVRRPGGSATSSPPPYTYALDPKLLPPSKDSTNVGQKVESKEEPTK